MQEPLERGAFRFSELAASAPRIGFGKGGSRSAGGSMIEPGHANVFETEGDGLSGRLMWLLSSGPPPRAISATPPLEPLSWSTTNR
jgi:hypothetical protein